jgi:peptide deformylase
MAILPLVIAPDPRLKKISEPVKKEDIDNDLRHFIGDLFDTMYENKGLGLAAVQVGVLKRILVMDMGKGTPRYEETYDANGEPDPICMINPEIVWASDEKFCFEEGCLSFPAQFSDVTRPKKVRVKYLDEFGDEQEKEFSEVSAVCVQHEMDHLNGIVFVDHISKIKKDMVMKKLEKFKKKGAF